MTPDTHHPSVWRPTRLDFAEWVYLGAFLYFNSVCAFAEWPSRDTFEAFCVLWAPAMLPIVVLWFVPVPKTWQGQVVNVVIASIAVAWNAGWARLLPTFL